VKTGIGGRGPGVGEQQRKRQKGKRRIRSQESEFRAIKSKFLGKIDVTAQVDRL